VADRTPVDLIGVHGGEWYGRSAGEALARAHVVVGAPRHLDAVGVHENQETCELGNDLDETFRRVAAWRDAGRAVAVLASGDPGFFGLARLAGACLGDDAIRIHPAPSSVALAFARAGLHWDDAVVVSAHGREPDTAVEAVQHHPKVAVLGSPACRPEDIGRLVLEAGVGSRHVVVASHLGEVDEVVWRGDLEGLAAGRFDPRSVVIALAPAPAAGATIAWGRPESEFAHRRGMITKAEVRAVALGKLALVPTGVMWDVGAGSGSVSAECARLAPGMRVFAIEKRAEDLERLETNLAGLDVTVVEGEAPGVLAGLPDADRVFVGGGGIDVLDAVLSRLRPGGRVVATYASLTRAADAAARLGHMVQVGISRAVPVGSDGSLRLAAENPVFVCWGPSDR
jgi:precorrin-6B C5,15-methyltransferase / cobalt-precorrin-6B C5,C15-methyltransferase